jgi:hypothetical protein
MATLVQISGKPASGKTTGARFLPAASTIVIDADKKGLSWAGWKKDYNKESKNYFPTSDIVDITKVLNFANGKPEVKYVIIDTINSIMTDKEVGDTKRPGFDEDTCRTKISLIAGISLRSVSYNIMMKYA